MYIVLVGTGYLTEATGLFETITAAESWAEENAIGVPWRVLLLRQP